MRVRLLSCLAVAVSATLSLPAPEARQAQTFDTIIRGGMVYDGSGSPGVRSDVGIRRDRVVAVRDLSAATATSALTSIPAHGVSPVRRTSSTVT